MARIPVFSAVLAEVRPPGPAHDHGLDRVAARRDAELAVAVEGDRAQVALAQAVRAEQLVAGGGQLVGRVRDLHVEQARGVLQALHVVAEPEDCRPFRRVVAADSLEDARSVVQAVNADMDLCIGPVDELPVHPDLLGLLHLRSFPRGAGKSSQGPRCRRRSRRTVAAGRPVGATPCASGFRRRSRRTAWPSRLRSISARVIARCGNGATPPGSKPVACTTSFAVRNPDLPCSEHRSDRLLVGPPVARDEREHVGAVADEHERLDDLAQLAADRLGRRARGRGAVR